MMASLIRRIIPLVLLASVVPALQAQREKLSEEDLAFVEKNFPNAQKTSTGLRYIIQQEGHGDPAIPGDVVSIIYAGRLLDGTVFDQNIDRAHPFAFRVGRNLVIEGWDQFLMRMKVGERSIVIIPAEMGYGVRGSAPRIPSNATLVFLVELLDIKREGVPP